MRSFCRKNHVHKIPPFRGGEFGVFWGGSADFILMGARIFLTMDAEGLGRKLLLTRSGDPCRAPEKQTVGTVTASHKMLTLQALSSSLNACTAGSKRSFWVPSGNLSTRTAASICTVSKGLLMVVSKRWFEFCGGAKLRYPLSTSI